MNNINKFIVYSLLTLSIIGGYFVCAYKKVFAAEMPTMVMDETFIETWLFPVFSLNNEWSFGQSGIDLKDAVEESAGTNNLDYSTDYNNAYSFAFGINDMVDPFDLSKADEFYTAYFATSVDYNKYVATHKIEDIKDYLTNADKQALEEALIDHQRAQILGFSSRQEAFNNAVIATIQIGKQKMLVAFDEAGEWLGSSFQNIITQVEPLTQPEINNLKFTAEQLYPQVDCSSTNSLSWVFPYDSRGSTYTYNFTFADNVLFYNQNIITNAYGSNYSITIVYPDPNHTLTLDSMVDLTITHYIATNPVGSQFYYYNYPITDFSTTFETIGGVDFRFSTLARVQNGTPIMSKNPYSSYNQCKQFIQTYVDSQTEKVDTPPYTVPLVDAQGVPYEVPTTQGLAQTIDHIYPAIDALRDTILTIPQDITDILTLVDTIPAILADEIEDIIADVIAESISIPKILTDTADPDNPNPDPDDPEEDPLPPYPPELPSWFWPTLFPDIFDFKGLEIFKPIFDIVGTNYSMYEVWVMIPAIIIFVVIIYFVISVL